MGGMRYIALLAVLGATVFADLSFLDTQGCRNCNICLKGNSYNVSLDNVCTYCRCHNDTTSTVETCPSGTEYSAKVDACIPSDRCPPEDDRCGRCDPCDSNLIKFNSTDPCGWCECKRDGSMEYHECPPGTGWEHYECVPKDECCNPDGCSQFTCPKCYHGMRFKFADPFNNCHFCCCEPVQNSTIEIPLPASCPPEMAFDPDLMECVYQPNLVCHQKQCHTTTVTLPTITTPVTCPPRAPDCNVTCPPEHYGEDWLMENPNNPCTFCCCYKDGTGKEIPHVRGCPHRDEYFDPVEKICKRNGDLCPKREHKPEHCREPGDKDGCNLMIALCDLDADKHLPNPYDEGSFCQCNEYGTEIHWMPCPPGTFKFVDSEGTCV